MLLASLVLAASSVAVQPDLELELVRHSLTGTHYRYRQVIDGVPVVNGEVNVTVAPTGERSETRALAAKSNVARALGPRFLVNVNGVARPARRVVTPIDDVRVIVGYYDLETNALLAEETNFS